MRWPWSKKPVAELPPDEGDDFKGSPWNADRIEPGDPGWDVLEQAMKTGKPVHGYYDREGNVYIDESDQ